MQNKEKEKEFFDQFSSKGDYDVFTPSGYKNLIKEYQKLLPQHTPQKPKTIDLGCGTGAFTRKFANAVNSHTFGLDISSKSTQLATKLSPDILYLTGDIEHCPIKNNTFDIVLLSGVLHHFPNFLPCLNESYRILKPGGCVLSYDPHIKNPFMWLYRHPDSPLFSPKGKTENERLLSAGEVETGLKTAGFANIQCYGKSGITFKYIESNLGRLFLPFYNLLERLTAFRPFAVRYGSFLICRGEKT